MKLAESTLRRIIREEIIALNEMDFVFHDEDKKGEQKLMKFTIQDVSEENKNVIYPEPNTVMFKSTAVDYQRKIKQRSTSETSKRSMKNYIEDFKKYRREVEPGEDKYMYVSDPLAIEYIRAAITGGVVDDPQKIPYFSRCLRRDAVERLSDEKKAAAVDLGITEENKEAKSLMVTELIPKQEQVVEPAHYDFYTGKYS